MPRRLDLDGWRRREHFDFFRRFEQPFFNVCTDVDVGPGAAATADGGSFFLGTLYLCLGAVNAVEELRMRLRGDDVVVHAQVDAGTTVMRDDRTFGFGYFDTCEPYAAFERAGRAVLDDVRRHDDLADRPERDDLVYLSVLPWIRFTSFAHARRCPITDSIPRIVFGARHRGSDGALRMPISIEVHHALVDGVHVADFLERFEARLAAAEELLAA